ncbi:T9SS type A sorting domain-containing protein [Parabacteroides sp. FAFU027]|uniref:T9SS type A sorting domain-containing protein n=1 Tax=Parabacteroides sp. FAFU027 TaxID=2922715 RepID=UPI001FAED65C|nr:T9SS type A sorting domain-containing protein [Parabacteroides sp. FAFU027]
MNRKLFTLFVAIMGLALWQTNVYATTYTATTTGTWTTTTWSPTSPTGLATDSIVINSGITVTLAANTTCGGIYVAGTLASGAYNLTCGNINIPTGGILQGDNTAGGTVRTLLTTGNWITVNGTLGSTTAGTSGENYRLYLNAAGTTTITGNGTIGIARIQAANASPGTSANQTFVIDNNIELRSNNSVTGQSAFNLTPVAYGSYTKTLTINANKTVKLYYASTSFGGYQSLSLLPWNSVQGGNVTININGTLDCSAGQFNLATTSGSSTTQNITINVGSTGSLLLGSTVRMYRPQSGQSININVADGGVIDGSSSAMSFFNTGSSALTGVSTNTSAPTTAATAAITTSTNCIYSVNGGLGGTGYTDGAAVTVSGGAGSGAIINLICNSVGAIIGYDIADGGTGYTSAPTITLPSTSGTTANAPTVSVTNASTYSIKTITLSTGGSGYSQNGFVTVNGTFTNSQYTPCIIAKVSGGVVTGFYKLHGGNGTASITATVIGGGAPTQWFAINGTNQTGMVKVNASAYTSNPVWIGTSNSNYDPITITPTANGVFSTNVHTTTTNFPAKYSTSINQVEWAITPTTAATADISLTPHSYLVNSTPIIAQKNTSVWVENNASFSSPIFTKTSMTLPASQNLFTTGTSGAYTVTSGTTGDWGTAATWADNVVPSANDNVVIASGHTVTVSSPANCGNLTKTGSLITNANLTVLGSLSGLGSHTGIAKTIMTGSGVAIGKGSTSNLEIATGSTANVITTTGDVTVNGDLTVTSGKFTMGAKVYTNNISIASGAIMNADNGASSQFLRRILTVGNGSAGNAVTVTVNGTLGSGTRYSNDGIDMEVHANAKTLTIGGSAGTIGIACLRPAANADSRTLDITINQNMTLNRDNGGASNIEPALTLQNNTGTYARTLTIPTGVTVTLRGNAGLHGLKNYVSGSDELLNNYASSSLNQGNCTYNVNGVLDLSYNNSICNLNTCSYTGNTQAVTINIGSTGTLKLGNIVKMYTALAGQSASIVPAAGSTIEYGYNGTPTFLLTTGNGTAPALPTYSNLRINNTSGVTFPSLSTVTGDLTLTAGYIGSSVTMGGSSAQTVNGNGKTVATLTIANTTGVSLASNLTATILNINPGAKLTNNGALNAPTFNILSDATGTGTYLDNGTTAATANVHQYLTGAGGTTPSGRFWYISCPVASSTLQGLTGTTTKLWYYNESSASYSGPYTDLATYPFSVGKGYVTRLGETSTANFTGTLNTGSQPINLTSQGTTAKKGYNLIGNPYPSYLNIEAVGLTSSTTVLTTVWFRSNPGNDATQMAFDTYNVLLHTGTKPSGHSASKYIPPMQAFWVKTKADTTLNFTNSMRVHQDSTLNKLKSATVDEQTQVIRLQVSNCAYSDEALLAFTSSAADSYDAYDSPKMTNNVDSIPEIYTLAGTEQVAINGLNSVANNPMLALGFKTGLANTNTYTIQATEVSNLNTGTQVVLVDNVANISTDLTDGTAYTFTSSSTNTASRFTLRLNTGSNVATGLTKTIDAQNFVIYPTGKGQVAIVKKGAAGNANAKVTNLLGQSILTTALVDETTVLGENLSTGVYLVSVKTANGQFTKKVIIE